MKKPLLEIVELSKSFGGLRALSDVTFTIAESEIVGLIGPNGAGKTTLFSAMAGLVKPTSGAIRLDGRDIAGQKAHRIAKFGLVKTFQNVALFLDCSVLDNVLTGGLMRHSVREARELGRQKLERVGIAGIAHKLARDLSFPERARVEVARALCTEPRVLLLDEAMAALNPIEMDEFLNLLRSLRSEGLTLAIVEHHMRAIMSLCERIIVLNFGKVIAMGKPDEIAQDADVVNAYLGRRAA